MGWPNLLGLVDRCWVVFVVGELVGANRRTLLYRTLESVGAVGESTVGAAAWGDIQLPDAARFTAL